MSRKPETVSTARWFLTCLLVAIPIVGLITLIVWAVSGESDPRRNWARAMLWLYVLIPVVIVAAVALVGVPLFGGEALQGLFNAFFG